MISTCDVALEIYDMLGREVSVEVNERREAGIHEAEFLAKDGYCVLLLARPSNRAIPPVHVVAQPKSESLSTAKSSFMTILCAGWTCHTRDQVRPSSALERTLRC